MGLTIHYRLCWPERGSAAAATQAVARLRQRCLDLPFAAVGEIKRFAGAACDYERYSRDDDTRGLLLESQGYIYCVEGADGRLTVRRPNTRWTASVAVVPQRVIAFTAWPGPGCESASFGLRCLPRTTTLHTADGGRYRLQVPETERGWRWGAFCKTQYANDPRYGGLQNFLRCHLTVIAALDAARELGFQVEVSDEGGFWKTRSVEALAREIGEWDRCLAALIGAFKDQAAAHGLSIEAPITERPDFEHLEAEGALDPKLRKLIETVAGAQA